jgi:hypothetical protein
MLIGRRQLDPMKPHQHQNRPDRRPELIPALQEKRIAGAAATSTGTSYDGAVFANAGDKAVAEDFLKFVTGKSAVGIWHAGQAGAA